MRVPWTARRSNQSILKKISPGCLPGSSPSRIQGYPQDDGLGDKESKKMGERKRLDLPLFTQKANKSPVFQGVILKEGQREKRREKERKGKKNDTGRPSFGERGP